MNTTVSKAMLVMAGIGFFATPAFAEDTVSEGSTVEKVDNPATKQADKTGYTSLVTLGMGLFPATFKANYRHLLNDKMSVLVGGGYGSAEWTGTDMTTSVTRIIGTAGMDYHPKANGMHGFYLGPRLTYTSWSFDYNYDDETIDGDAFWKSSKITAAGIVGWRWVWNPGPSLALGIGPKYVSRVSETGSEDSSLSWGKDGVGVKTEFQLGWAF